MSAIRAEMAALAIQLVTSLQLQPEAHDQREALWMRREDLRAQLAA
jgi:hypothetical protein